MRHGILTPWELYQHRIMFKLRGSREGGEIRFIQSGVEYVAIERLWPLLSLESLGVCEVDKQREPYQTQAKQVKNHRHETACLKNDHSFFWRLTFETHSRNPGVGRR